MGEELTAGPRGMADRRGNRFLVIVVHLSAVLSLLCSSLAIAQSESPVFVANTDLQLIAVRVVDKQGRDVQGLKSSDFTILEDNRQQQIAFFAAENQPMSVAVLLDTSSSMQSSQKLSRTRALLTRLFRAAVPNDEVYFIPFTYRAGPFQQLTAPARSQPFTQTVGAGSDGTALYDALATTLCNMKTARNPRQAVVVITDGADQHSRLLLDPSAKTLHKNRVEPRLGLVALPPL